MPMKTDTPSVELKPTCAKCNAFRRRFCCTVSNIDSLPAGAGDAVIWFIVDACVCVDPFSGARFADKSIFMEFSLVFGGCQSRFLDPNRQFNPLQWEIQKESYAKRMVESLNFVEMLMRSIKNVHWHVPIAKKSFKLKQIASIANE